MSEYVGPSVATWLLFALLCVFIGVGLRTRFFRCATDDAEDWLAAFWIGWCGLVSFLQLFHLVHRIDAFALIAAIALALAGAWLGRADLGRALRRGLRGRVGLAVMIAVGAVWLSTQAARPPGNFDSGLYHIQAIKWNNACAIVPGLGNFHYRLAYNNSSFLYAALMQVVPPHKAIHLASGLLVMAMLVQLFVAGRELMSRTRQVTIGSLTTLALAPAILAQVLEPNMWTEGWSSGWNQFSPSNVSSPTPDLVVYALGVAVTPLVVTLLWGEANERKRDATLATLMTLVLVGVTVKLSFVVFGCLALAVAAFAFWRDTRDTALLLRFTRYAFIIALCSVGVWLVRGIILSGYFLYPAYKLGSLPVSWRIPRAVAQGDYDSMQSWARVPGWSAESPLGNWRWIDGWYAREFAYWRRLGMPLSVSGCAVALALLSRRGEPARARPWRAWLILLPPIVAIVFWFVTMPVSRYLGSTMWCLAAGAIMLALAHHERRAAAVGVALLSLALSLDTFRMWQVVAPNQFQPIPVATGAPFETKSGLWIQRLQQIGYQPWDGILLLSPTATEHLRQRVPGELCSGFASQ